MSYLYGRLTKTVTDASPLQRTVLGQAETPEQKAAAVAQKVAALVPGDILAIHAAILAGATELAKDGSTTVTKPEVLKWSLPILAAVSVVLFVAGRLPNWEPKDYVRVLIPPTAFFGWTLLTGTSAATPWFANIDHLWVVLLGGCIAIVVLAAADRMLPKQT